jgi:hypothetical protein
MSDFAPPMSIPSPTPLPFDVLDKRSGLDFVNLIQSVEIRQVHALERLRLVIVLFQERLIIRIIQYGGTSWIRFSLGMTDALKRSEFNDYPILDSFLALELNPIEPVSEPLNGVLVVVGDVDVSPRVTADGSGWHVIEMRVGGERAEEFLQGFFQ